MLGESTFVPSLCFAFLRFHSPPNDTLCTRKKIPHSRKLFKGENFHEFRGFVVVRESFLRPLVRQKRAIRKIFIRKNHIFTNSRKFSPSKVSRYTVTAEYKL